MQVEAAGRTNTRGQLYLLGLDGVPLALSVRLGISDGSSTELLVAPGALAAADLREGATVIVGIQTPVAGAAKPGGTIAFMTSILGSVALRQHGMTELYSASKAALNSLTRGFAATDAKDYAVLNLHPGWVKTDMGGAGADIDIATSVTGLADVIEAESAPGDRYLDYTGKTLPW